MQLNKINWFGLAGGILTLAVLIVSLFSPWWQLTVGDNMMKVNASPVNTNFGLFGTNFTVPLIWALNIVSILTFTVSGIIMLIYSLIPLKSYSKQLLSFAYRKPLYAVLSAVIGLVIIIFIVQAVAGINVPLMGQSTINLPSNMAEGINISVAVSGAFQWPFYLAIVAAALCITARFYHPIISKTPKAEPSPIVPPTLPPATSV